MSLAALLAIYYVEEEDKGAKQSLRKGVAQPVDLKRVGLSEEVKEMPNIPKKVIDTRSSQIFKSLNKCYLALLRAGELKEMRMAGKLADHPEQDNFGYYKMRRFYLGRFVQEDDSRWDEAYPASKNMKQYD